MILYLSFTTYRGGIYECLRKRFTRRLKKQRLCSVSTDGLSSWLQHVLAMFVSNITPSIIIAGAAGFAFGSADTVFLFKCLCYLQA